MSDLRVLIADDDPGARAALRAALEDATDLTVVDAVADGESAYAAIRTLRPDIAFLDIEMPPPDGLEIVARLGDDAPAIVFVTAHDRHAIAAFDLHVVDYVLKPFEEDRIREAAARAARRVAEPDGDLRRMHALVASLRPDSAEGGHARRILVRSDDRYRFVPVEQVDWFEADRNYVRLHTGGQTFRVRNNLSNILATLDPRRFVRIHRSHVVNVDRVAEVQPWFNGDCIAILQDGQQLRVSRTYRDDLLRPIV